MKTDKSSNEVMCPKCSREAELQLCYACHRFGGVAPLVPRDRCSICKGKGVVIHCKSCATRSRQIAQDAAVRKEELKALKKNPFLPYYDPKFKKYRK